MMAIGASHGTGPKIDYRDAKVGWVKLPDGACKLLQACQDEQFFTLVDTALLSIKGQKRAACQVALRELNDGFLDLPAKWCMLNILLEHGAMVCLYKSREECEKAA